MKVGRNDPCPCGSGKKFKNCHLGRERQLQPDADGVVQEVPAGPPRGVLMAIGGVGLVAAIAAGAARGPSAALVVAVAFVLFGVGYAILRNPPGGAGGGDPGGINFGA